MEIMTTYDSRAWLRRRNRIEKYGSLKQAGKTFQIGYVICLLLRSHRRKQLNWKKKKDFSVTVDIHSLEMIDFSFCPCTQVWSRVGYDWLSKNLMILSKTRLESYNDPRPSTNLCLCLCRGALVPRGIRRVPLMWGNCQEHFCTIVLGRLCSFHHPRGPLTQS